VRIILPPFDLPPANFLSVEFAVADITEIFWDESIFDQLRIPCKSKTLIRALTAQLSSQEKAQLFDDFVKGKKVVV
jgi:hypothetical protein